MAQSLPGAIRPLQPMDLASSLANCAVPEIGRAEAGAAHGLGHLRCAGEIVLLCEVEAQELRPRAVHGRRR